MLAPNHPNAPDSWRGDGLVRNTWGAARPLSVRPAAPPLPNLRDPALYLDFFGQTLDYASLPHKSEQYMALGSDISAEPQAWG